MNATWRPANISDLDPVIPIVNFDLSNRLSLPVIAGWRRKDEWRWPRPS
ncbi:MAG: hypothetical protein ABI607_13680 [Betaproteobacteria bacterium]